MFLVSFESLNHCSSFTGSPRRGAVGARTFECPQAAAARGRTTVDYEGDFKISAFVLPSKSPEIRPKNRE